MPPGTVCPLTGPRPWRRTAATAAAAPSRITNLRGRPIAAPPCTGGSLVGRAHGDRGRPGRLELVPGVTRSGAAEGEASRVRGAGGPRERLHKFVCELGGLGRKTDVPAR